MNLLDVFFIGVGLSMDAFAVSICKGLKMKVIDLKQSFIIAFFFGAFQLMMPLIGYALSASFVEYINKYSHWIAFVLLLVIGVNMIREALGDSEEEKEVGNIDLGISYSNWDYNICNIPWWSFYWKCLWS